MTKLACEKCDGRCCKYVAIEIDNPTEIKDFEDIRWYVAHKNIQVYVDDDYQWHVEFITSCEHLGKNNLCEIYEKRPKICREYSQDECLFYNDYEEKYNFKSVEEIDEYIKNIFKKGKHVIVDENKN